MAGNRIELAGVEGIESETRREWVKPQILDMLAGAAETGGQNSIDGDPGLS